MIQNPDDTLEALSVRSLSSTNKPSLTSLHGGKLGLRLFELRTDVCLKPISHAVAWNPNAVFWVDLFLCLSVHSLVCLAVCLVVYLSACFCLFVCQFVCLFIVPKISISCELTLEVTLSSNGLDVDVRRIISRVIFVQLKIIYVFVKNTLNWRPPCTWGHWTILS